MFRSRPIVQEWESAEEITRPAAYIAVISPQCGTHSRDKPVDEAGVRVSEINRYRSITRGAYATVWPENVGE